MISEEKAEMYCCEDASKIENYDKAIADQKRMWHIHHRAERLPCGRFSRQVLKKFRLYYNQPADRLIFLSPTEHSRLHNTGRKNPKAVKAMRKARAGSRNSEEHNHKISEANKGKQSWLGKHHTDETKQKLSKARKGKPGHSQTGESRTKISKTRSGMKWYTNGVVEICTHGERPDGFVPGRLKK